MTKQKKYIITGLGIILLFYLDFVRDYFFKNIGFQIYYLNHLSNTGIASIDNYTDSFIEQFISKYSIPQLNNIKWGLTAFFIILFGVLGALINSFFYDTKKVTFYFISMYFGLFIISLLTYLTIKLTNEYSFQTKTYLISMEIAHFLQSSLPTLLFLVSFKLYQQNEK